MPRILLVEEEDAVRRDRQLLLGGQGYDVRAYQSPVGLFCNPEALRAACLIAGLLLPGKDALCLLAELTEAGWNGPAILISGVLSDDRKSQAYAAGFDLVLHKSISDFTLVRAVRVLLERAARLANEAPKDGKAGSAESAVLL